MLKVQLVQLTTTQLSTVQRLNSRYRRKNNFAGENQIFLARNISAAKNKFRRRKRKISRADGMGIRIVGYHSSSRLTATLNLSLIYIRITLALDILLEHMYKTFKINWTKIKGGCQSGRKVATHTSKSDLPLGQFFDF